MSLKNRSEVPTAPEVSAAFSHPEVEATEAVEAARVAVEHSQRISVAAVGTIAHGASGLIENTAEAITNSPEAKIIDLSTRICELRAEALKRQNQDDYDLAA